MQSVVKRLVIATELPLNWLWRPLIKMTKSALRVKSEPIDAPVASSGTSLARPSEKERKMVRHEDPRV